MRIQDPVLVEQPPRTWSPSIHTVTNDVMEDDNKHYVTVWMEGDHVSGEPMVAAEHELSEVGWFRWSELPSPLFKCLENLVQKRSYPGHGA